jgi:hypothetical protein
MYTLRHASEVRSMSAIDELKSVPSKMKPDEVKLARQVIGNFETGGDLTQYKDDYQEELRRIIDAKIEGKEVVAQEEEEAPKVVNLMEALRQSLERVSTSKKRTAKISQEPVAKSAVRASREEARPRLVKGDTAPPAVLASCRGHHPKDGARGTDTATRDAGNTPAIPANLK